MQQADGAWRDAKNRHQQAVTSVMRLEKNLEAAREKESRLAREVAEATLVRAQAASAVAKLEGVNTARGDPGGGEPADKKPFDIVWDQELFANLEELECEPHERDTLKKCLEELQAQKATLSSKADEVTKLVERARSTRATISERLAKKRRNADDDVPGGAPSGHAQPDAAPVPSPTTEQTQKQQEDYAAK
eukprot:3826116-Pyramimonas_sp.AAC.1